MREILTKKRRIEIIKKIDKVVVFDWRTLVRLQCRREESSNSRIASTNRQEMAIPFALPSDDEAETQTQQLEQLMLDLYAALQQVLRSRTAQHPSSRNREFNEFLRHILTYLEIFVRILTHLTSDPLRWTSCFVRGNSLWVFLNRMERPL